MGQILTDEAVILYDPIQTIFDVLVTGGDLNQQQNVISGEYSPDRAIAPILITPTLKVTNPNTGDTGTEKIASCTVVWYLVNGNVETEITSTDTENASYAKSGKNLLVRANIAAGQHQELLVRVDFPDSYSGSNIHFERRMSLGCTATKDYDPMLTLDIPNLATVNPFYSEEGETRVVRATFHAGMQDISTDAKMVYIWEKLDGSSYRAINSTDIEVASIPTRTVTINGVATTVQYRTMTLRTDCIGHCKYRCTAYHVDRSESQFRQAVTFTVDREMYGARPEVTVTQGKYLKGSTDSSTAEFVLHVNSNKVNDPTKYYCVKWNFYRLHGTQKEGETMLGWGQSATAGRDLSGTDKTRKPTFRAEIYPLSELQLLTDDEGVAITDDSGSSSASSYGGYVVGQVMEDL